jgi:hypothetical protein
MWEILLIIASRLEPQFCGIDVFKKSLSPEDISSLIIELERQNFISYEYKENKSGIKIIRMIQDEVDKHIDQIGDKKWDYLTNCDERLLSTFDSLFGTSLSKNDFKQAELLYPHLNKLFNNIEINPNKKNFNPKLLNNLNFNLSLYHFKSTKKYDFSIKHTRKYIDICRCFHQDFNSNYLIRS